MTRTFPTAGDLAYCRAVIEAEPTGRLALLATITPSQARTLRLLEGLDSARTGPPGVRCWWIPPIYFERTPPRPGDPPCPATAQRETLSCWQSNALAPYGLTDARLAATYLEVFGTPAPAPHGRPETTFRELHAVLAHLGEVQP